MLLSNCSPQIIKFLSGTFLFTSCSTAGNHREDLKKYFDEYDVTGCFELYDLKNSGFTDYDPDRCSQRFIPASTFKIFNSLVGLQTGAVKDEHEVIKWDSVSRTIILWNHDQDMSEAIRNSTVWYYQEIARRVGASKMQQYLNVSHYGNMVMGGAIDSFWLTGGLRISCDEQIEFLKNFYTYKLPFSERTTDIVKNMIVIEDTMGYKLSGKTGWGLMKDQESGTTMNIGWFVGYVEKDDNVYFFATNIEAPEPAPQNFAAARKEITKNCLKELGIL